MFDSRSTRTVSKIVTRLNKDHRRSLRAGEEFVAACDAFPADEPDPAVAAKIKGGASSQEGLSARGAAHLRLAAVKSQLGMIDQEFAELPRTKSGYLTAHTQQRAFIFDRQGRSPVMETEIADVWLQPIAHPDGLYTLVFGNADIRVAIATPGASSKMTRHFIESFPDRRSTPRVPTVSGQPRIAGF